MHIHNKHRGFDGNKCRRMIFLVLLAFSFIPTYGQNLNNPNKKGPLGTQVNTLSGNLFIKRTDINVPARGFDIDISFYYNSYLFSEEVGFGKGWSFKYAIQYRRDSLGRKIILWGDGRDDIYDSLPGNIHKSPKGFYSKLNEYQTGKYRLVEPEGVIYFFDNPVHRKVTRMQEPNGNFLNFVYTDSLLTSLINNAGQAITFAYNPEGRIVSVTDAIASPTRIYTYSYTQAGTLKEVTDPLGGKFRYTYLVNGPMSGLTDKNNNKIDIIYYPDMSTRELIGCNKRSSFSYDTASNRTIVTDHFDNGGTNQVTTYTYKKLGNLAWISSMAGNCCGFNMKYEYDENGNQLERVDANGQTYKYTYDEKGNVLTSTDPLGNVSTYTYEPLYNLITSFKDPKGFIYNLTYDSKGNLTQLVAPGNNVYTATYNSTGDIITSTDPKGNIFSYNYDAFGMPTTVTGPNGYQTTLSFDARGNLTGYVDARGNVSSAEYDILNRMKIITDPINNKLQFAYDANGNLVTYKNENNETIQYNYDASNRMVKITAPMGLDAAFTYDPMDNLKSIKNALGYQTSFTYDTRNRPVVAKDADDKDIKYSYDGNGNVTKMTKANGQTTNFTYDLVNRLVGITDNNGPVATFTYDKNGNIISYTNGVGAVASVAYDSLDRVKQFVDPIGNTVSYTYDKNDNITSITDREGHTRFYTYDSFDRILTYTDNNGFVVTAGYDIEGNIVSLKDQNNNITTYAYDSLNRRKTTTYPDGKFLQYAYDKEGNMVSKKLTDGSTILYTYDSLNRVTTRTLPGGEAFNYTYDKLGRILTATNSQGVVSFTYDKMDRVTSETFGGRTTAYAYDIEGRTQTTTYPDNSVIIKEFDTRDRITRILKDSVLVAEYVYNNIDKVTNTSFANGISSTRQYDLNGRLSSVTTGTLQNTSFTYDKEGNKTSIIRNNSLSQSEQFSYDNGYRLTNYKRGPAGSPVIQNTYTYDAVGNRTAANLNGAATTYTVNNLNQLTALNGTGFTFDNRGNITYDGNYYKTYDAEGRLVKDSSSPSNVIVYGYDALSRRILKSINGNVSRYGYSNAKQIEERDGSGNVLNKTIYTNFLSPVMIERNGSKYFYHANELKSVEAISNEDGRLIERYSYDVYGKPFRFDSLDNPLASSIAGNRMGFTGQEYDSATGSYRFFYRNYSPETGVFNQRDLIEYQDGMGMYQYVGNNPANGVDIWGLKKDCIEGIDLRNIWDIPITPFDDALRDLGELAHNSNLTEAERSELWSSFAKGSGQAGLTSLATSGGIKAIFKKTPLGFMAQGIQKAAPIAKAAIRSAPGALARGGTMLAGAVGTAGLSTAAVGAPIGGVLMYKWHLDKEQAERDAYQSELDADSYMREMGKDDWDKTERVLKLSGMRKIIEERERAKDNCPEGGTQKKGRWIWDPNKLMWVFVPVDPNLIIGPDGVDEKKWVSVNDRMPYTVLFENDSAATARARYIRITTPIEPKQDPATLELGSVGFNNQSFDIPTGVSSYYQRLDARDSTGVYVDITAGYNVIKNEIFWEFQAIDPITLMPPEDPLAGFLFLRDSIQKAYGNGFVNFTIKPLASALTLDTIGARAFIVFDGNDVIPTNIHTNTIDAFAPTSQLTTATITGNNMVALTWAGADDVNGCGVSYYTVYVSTDQVNYSILFSKVYGNDTTFALPAGTDYCFFVLSTDKVGNQEKLRPGTVQCATTGSALPVTWLSFTGTNQGRNNILNWATASEFNSKEFRLERSLNGTSWTDINIVPAAGNSTSVRRYQYTDANINLLNSEVMFYRVKQIDIDGRWTYTSIVRLAYRENGSQPSIVYPNPTSGSINIMIGDKKLVGTDAMILDVNGRVLQRITLTSTNQSFDLGRFVNGIYLIRLSNKETLRVIKQ